MVVSPEKRAVGVFSTYQEAKAALNELQRVGFSMNQVSVLGKDAEDLQDLRTDGVHPQAAAETTQVEEGAKKGALAGGAAGGLTGLLVGLGTLAIPGVGPIMLAGAAATALATTVAGGAIGATAGGLLGGLVGLGIPEDRAELYQRYITQGEYLIIVDGTEAEVWQAEKVSRNHKVREWEIYNLTPASDGPYLG